MNISYKYWLAFVVLLGISGCKFTQHLTPNKPIVNPPESYINEPVVHLDELPSYGEFFKDSTLTGLISTALKNNFDLQMSLQHIKFAKANIKMSSALGLPNVMAGLSIGGKKFGNYTTDGVGNYDTRFSTNINEKQMIPETVIPDYLVGVSASWELDVWKKLSNQKQVAFHKLLSSQYGKNFNETLLVCEVADLYFELLILDNELHFIDENIQLQQYSLDIVRLLKQAGEENELGVALLNAQLLNSQALKIEVKQQIFSNESRINFLLGRYPQAITRPSISWEKVIPPTFSTGVPSKLVKNRPDILQAEQELLACNADLASAKAAFYPTFTISSGLGLQAFKALLLFDVGSFTYNLAGGLVAPVFNRRQLKGNLMASNATQQMAYLNYQKSIVNGFTEVYNCLNMLENMNQTYTLKVEEVNTLKRSISISAELFKSGRATYLEVVTAQKNALQSQIELINIKKKQFNAVINLYKSIGGGWAKF